MSATVLNVFEKLSYEPVLDSDSMLKSWVKSHNSGVLGAFIDGQLLAAGDEEKASRFLVKNPYSGDTLATVANCDKATLDRAVQSAHASHNSWKSKSATERGRVIYSIARNVQKHLTAIVQCESVSGGRTSREVKDLDIATVIKTLYYYAGSVGLDCSCAGYETLGVVAIVGHYDSPLLSLVSKLAPALVTGNTCVLVPHKLTPLSAYMFADICAQSGLPPGVLNLIVSDNHDVYKWIATHPLIDCVSFDGKTQTGQELILQQSFVHPSKRVLLSLEGKSALVVYDSADLDSAVESIVDGCLYSNGQHRHSLNKVFVQETVGEEVCRRLEARFSKLCAGNPMNKNNDLGGLVNAQDVAQLNEALIVQQTQQEGQIKEFNANNADKDKCSCLVAPKIIKNVALNAHLNLNEYNGPYVMIIPFRTVKESVELVNCNRFGSGVSLHSQNISLVMEVAYLVNVGTVWINSIPIERGVQTRKQSGNYSISGFRSLKNFLRTKRAASLRHRADESSVEMESALKSLRSFGAVDSAHTLPVAQTVSVEKTYKMYIGGKQVRPDTQTSRAFYLPRDQSQLYCLLADASRKDVRNAVEAAQSAFGSWSKRANHNKSQILYFIGENLSARSKEFVGKLQLLGGKEQAEAEREFNLCLDVIFHFASTCDKKTGNLNDTAEYGYLLESNEALGCIAIVCGHDAADNYPLLSFVMHLMGAIAHGNTAIIVPDAKCPVLALDLYEVFETSDLPDGVVNILSGDKHHLTKCLCDHQNVNSVWYLSDEAADDQAALIGAELDAQRYVSYTSSFSLKLSWLTTSKVDIASNFVSKSYLKEISFNSKQSKFIHIPMGTIFAN